MMGSKIKSPKKTGATAKWATILSISLNHFHRLNRSIWKRIKLRLFSSIRTGLPLKLSITRCLQAHRYQSSILPTGLTGAIHILCQDRTSLHSATNFQKRRIRTLRGYLSRLWNRLGISWANSPNFSWVRRRMAKRQLLKTWRTQTARSSKTKVRATCM